ncbi:MAG: DMT family transporter [Anaerovoracaceae bacterium]
MQNTDTKKSLLTSTLAVVGLAVISCGLWGSAPVCIKLGYEAFQIDSSNTLSILVFAGARFSMAGLLVILVCSGLSRKPLLPRRSSWRAILPLALTQTALQYLLYYIGVAHASGVKASVLSGSGSFFSVIIACLIFRQEKLTANKLLGCLIGFAGIVLINLSGLTGSASGMVLDMSFLGEGFVLLATISGSVSAVLIHHFSQSENPVMLSGWQFFTGGLFLLLVGLLGGGRLPQPCWQGFALLFYLAFVSAVAYTLWSLLLSQNPVSRIAVFNFLIPVFGVILSTILLNENGMFSVNTVLSLLLVCFGIWLVNRTKAGSAD